jgi:hypothetical protein
MECIYKQQEEFIMKVITVNEAKAVKAGWTCWLCGAHGWDSGSYARHVTSKFISYTIGL